MAKVIHTILSLTDNMSGGLVKAAKNTQGVSKEMASATRSVVNFSKKAESAIGGAMKKTVGAIGGVMKKTVKWGGLTAATLGALASKTGLSEAMDLEGYRLQLETATKDTKKASQIMQNAINLANRTPFEGGELVEGAAKFEAMGMSADTWLTRAGDMAAATNKSFDQAVEALIDAQNGELERLKEFGITKAKILEQGEKMFAGVQIVNKKGQIVNEKKFNEALVALMEDRFAGGMEKQAGTMKGLWSTVTGVTKSALASIVGISSDGSIKSGSALDFLKGKVSTLADKLQQWQQDGTIDRIAQKFTDGLGKAVEYAGKAFQWVTEHGDTIDKVAQMFTDGLGKAVEYAGKAFQWVTEHGDTIKRWAVGLGSALAMVKVAKFGNSVFSAIKTVKLFGSTLIALVSANPIVLLIGAAIAAGALLIANWDKVKAFAVGLWDKTKEVFGGIRDSITGAFDTVKEKVGGVFDWIGEKLGGLDEKISGIPVIGSLYNTVKGGVSWFMDRSFGSGVTMKETKSTPFAVGTTSIPGNATGTSYFRGGWTRINERGGEIVNLPGGTQIIPHDVSRRAAGQTVKVYVTVQGNVIGNRAYAEELGEIVGRRILQALRNT